jgi:Protein kinase domain
VFGLEKLCNNLPCSCCIRHPPPCGRPSAMCTAVAHRPPGRSTIVVTRHCPPEMRNRPSWSVDQFVMARKLGGGYASTVHLAVCKATGTQVAIKVYHRCKLSLLNNYQVQREIRIHSCLDHKNVLQLVRARRIPWGCGVSLSPSSSCEGAGPQHACLPSMNACMPLSCCCCCCCCCPNITENINNTPPSPSFVSLRLA